MSSHSWLIPLGLLVIGGCAAVPPARLSSTHPASPDAVEGAAAQSTTLAFNGPAPVGVDPAALKPEMDHAGHGGHGAHRHEAPPTQPGENAGLSAARWTPTSQPTTSPAGTYFCPMHKEVVTDHPDRCPKCGMKLVVKPTTQPANKTAGHDHASHGGQP